MIYQSRLLYNTIYSKNQYTLSFDLSKTTSVDFFDLEGEDYRLLMEKYCRNQDYFLGFEFNKELHMSSLKNIEPVITSWQMRICYRDMNHLKFFITFSTENDALLSRLSFN